MLKSKNYNGIMFLLDMLLRSREIEFIQTGKMKGEVCNVCIKEKTSFT